MRLTPIHGDNGGFCLINTSFQYNAFFRETDEQASTTSKGSELGGGRGAQHAVQRFREAVCVRARVFVGRAYGPRSPPAKSFTKYDAAHRINPSSSSYRIDSCGAVC